VVDLDALTGRSAVSPGKYAVPRLSSAVVSRPRLTAILDAAAPGQLVLVSAAAGYGKTVLLAEWVAARLHRTAWVTLDEDDNLDHRFWAGVLAALDACPALGSAAALRSLPVPERPSRDPGFLATVLDAVTAATGRVTLVLDDVHVLVHPDPLHGLASLVRDRPPQLQVVLLTRRDPPLRLDRLRLVGQVVDVRAAHLAFSLEEASALLAASGVRVTPGQVDVLSAQTEGWAAGLCLAAMSMSSGGDPEVFLRDLVGNAMALSDYLVGEILSRMPADVLDVLSAVGVCEHVTAPLAAALSGREDAGEVLADLEQATSLVTSYGTGRRWFRVHPLLRAQLRADLHRRRPDRSAVLNGRAARHRAAAGDTAAALRHARLADDPDLLVELLRARGAAMAASGHHSSVLDALEALPSERRSGDARLVLVAALAHLEVGHLAAVDRLLAQVDTIQATAVEADDADPDLAALRTAVRRRRGLLGSDGTRVVELLLGVDATLEAGRLHGEEDVARTAIAEARRHGNAYLEARSTVTLGVLVGLRGDVPQSVTLARRACAIAPAHHWRGTVGDAYARFLHGYGALLQGRPDDCLRWTAAEGAASASSGETTSIVPGLDVLRAAARFDLGEHRAALAAMTAIRSAARGGPVLDRPTLALAAAVEHGAAAVLGMRAHARAVAEWAEDELGTTGDVLVMQAWGPATIGRDDAARDRLCGVLDGSVACTVHWLRQEALLLECAMALRSGAVSRARHVLERTVALADATGTLRPLIDASAGVGALLAERVGHFGARDPLVRDVLRLRSARGLRPATPLTEREREVLDLLPTLLSLDEIAEALSVSINTVRSHVRALHGKLGVSSRADTVLVAAHSGLIGVRSPESG
jgi:LuxR family transcriptional regulator, maltose regulon positive regulatory protein